MKQELELYIHIPFCVRKCNYCDFLSFPQPTDVHGRYVTQLLREIRAAAPDCREMIVRSVFIGGGTPSLIGESLIEELMATVRSCYRMAEDAEVTIECNPGSTLRHKFAAYRRAGINRLSIGLQSADNAELKMLGRVHSFEEFLKSYQNARMEGFKNINVDLINCIPMQSLKTWKKTLRTVLMLKPEHVSVYNLIIEEGTPFYQMQEEGLLMMPSEEEQAEIDTFTKEYLARQGYHRYEISNWAREGLECRHNSGYWTGVPYLGFGLGAASYFDRKRWNNTSDLSEYMDFDFVGDRSGTVRKDVRELSREEQIEEFMFLGLRMTKGISSSSFLSRFGQHLDSVYGKILDKDIISGLIESCDGRYRLTERGMDVSNVVLSGFLLSKPEEG
ncbi:MAG: oxygen-independent coproporphyrinogen III oxidase [Lachnospiraceae bacterium]|jgi:oxygen-independent coproporphyrinogen-3 oxidase|nr:oxygen-independent coproporphyrinogen III oxidase [Lachnospiraceae bacterium]